MVTPNAEPPVPPGAASAGGDCRSGIHGDFLSSGGLHHRTPWELRALAIDMVTTHEVVIAGAFDSSSHTRIPSIPSACLNVLVQGT